MGIITTIEPVTKTKYRIYVDDRFAFVLNKGELSHYGIEADAELSEEVQEEILNDVVYKDAVAYANRVLSTADKTEQQLRDGLTRKEFPESITDRVIELCKEHRLINDKRYAEQYVTSYASRKSRRVIRMELQRKGIAESIIETVMEGQELGDQELEGVMTLLRKKWRDREELSYQDMQKLQAYLMRRGYSYDVIRRGIREYSEVQNGN